MRPTLDIAQQIVQKYNREAFHLQHAQTVSRVMGKLAEKYDPGMEDYWAVVGMLHDVDFELYPDQHCVKAIEILKDEEVDEDIIHAVISHGWGLCSDVEPVRYMEKVLYATDELTGLIGAAALMRPTGFEGMETKSVMKKFKDKKFAAGCSREVIEHGAKMLDMELSELIAVTLEAMKT